MSTDITRHETETSGTPSLRLAAKDKNMHEGKPVIPRQFVNFTFYRVRPEWRLLDAQARAEQKQEFIETITEAEQNLLINTYSLVGLRTRAT